MTDSQIGQIVTEVLSAYAPEAGFLGAEVVSGYDFDGDPVLRVTARYRRRPVEKPDKLINSVHPIRDALIALGDDRPVLVKNDVETERLEDELLVEEDAG